MLVKAQGIEQVNRKLGATQAEMQKTNSAATRMGSGVQRGAATAAKGADDMAARHKAGADTVVKASKYATIAVGGLAAGAVKLAGDYQSSMNTLQAVSGSSGREMKKLSALAIQLGNDVKLPGTSAQDAAEAMTEMIKAGVSLKDTMAGVRGVLVLSAAAGVSNARAAEIASNALNTFKLKGKDVNYVVDQLANTANASSVEIGDVADATKMAGAVFSAFQGPVRGAKGAMTDLNVAIGILGNAGIKGSDAGTSLKQTLLQLTGPSNKSKDAMKALYIAAKDYGASEKDVATAIRGSTKERGVALGHLIAHNKALGGSADIAYDATGKMRSLKDIITLTSAATKHMTQEQKNAALTQIFGADATRSVITLMKAGPHEWDKMTAAVTKQGSAQRLATAKMKGFKGSLEAAKSAVETLAIEFGTVLLPAVTAVVRRFASATNVLGEHKTATLAVLGTIGALAATVWTVNTAMRAYRATLLAVGAIQAAFAAATGGLVAVMNAVKLSTAGTVIGLGVLKVAEIASTATTGALTAATWALNGALAVLTSPITLVVVAIAALAAGIIYAYRHSVTFRKVVDAAWQLLKTFAIWLVTVGTAAFNALATAVRIAWGTVRIVTTTVWGGVRTLLTTVWGVLRTVAGAVFGGIATGITTAWHTVQTVTTTVWGGLRTAATTVWDGIRTAVLTPVRAVRDALGGKDGLWAQMHGAATAAWEKIKTGAASFAGKLKDVIVGAFEGAANKVIDFVNAIIGVINKIPGVPNIGKIDHIGGGGKSSGGGGGPNGTGHLARGGMLVPGLGSGDKVPLHLGGRLAAMVEPGEFVSVANRNATAALMGVNSAVPRFNTGGILNTQEMADLWRSKGGSASLADTMGVIGLVESGGKPWNVNPTSGAAGLWQILGQLIPGNLLNPGVNALNAIAKYKAQGLHAWDASRSKWEPLLGKAVGLDPLALIGQLPGVGGLPDWLKGTGRYVLSHVGKWIKDNVVKLIPGGGGGPTASGPSGVGVFEGVPMANWVIGALKYGRRHGAFGSPTSGYRPGFDPHTASGTSEHQGTRYPHGAVDFGGYHDIRALLEKTSYVRATAGYKYPLLAPKGFVDDGHASGTGHRRGGILGEHKPFVGSYGDGGVVPRDGYGFLHRGEEVLRRDQRRGPLVNVENLNVHSRIDENSLLERLAFKVSTA